MKIAIPVAEGRLATHFGHCGQFALFDVDEDSHTITGNQLLDAPEHGPGVLPGWLAGNGVTLIIAGGMGTRAQMLFKEFGIEVVTGAPADEPQKLAQAYLDGTLQSGENVCDH